ncbi:MAG: MmgE/PrpD family protein [Actinomycetota bacterium]|nr:MmgE/PrpD family protein [Actinomycetota bacterium]
MTITDELWERWGRLTIDDVPDEVAVLARQCVLDWFGCALAGRAEPLAGILRAELGTIAGRSTVLGQSARCAAGQAAMINGAIGHALDYDDTHTTMGGHPTVPLLPAALALAEDLDATGAELLAAFVAGFEVECCLGVALGGRPYANGWHTTSVIGVFGAAAACARLLGLDCEQFGHALGIAASQASGLKANFGTMTKPLHAGQAAERGVLAARLAQRGFTADPDAFESNQGLVQATGSPGVQRDRLDGVADEWLIRRTLFKYHAACYLTHAAIESAAALRPRLDAGDVERVKLVVKPSILDVCGIPEPTTGLEAKFSLRATTAMALLGDDTSDPEAFSDARARSEEVQELLARVEVTTDDALRQTESIVRVHASGASHEARHDSGIPATDLDAQGRRLRAKFDALAVPVLGSGAKALADRIDTLDQLPHATDLAHF